MNTVLIDVGDVAFKGVHIDEVPYIIALEIGTFVGYTNLNSVLRKTPREHIKKVKLEYLGKMKSVLLIDLKGIKDLLSRSNKPAFDTPLPKG